MATLLQLLSFLGASFDERIFHQYCLVVNFWNG